jgi:hypothetical protein
MSAAKIGTTMHENGAEGWRFAEPATHLHRCPHSQANVEITLSLPVYLWRDQQVSGLDPHDIG